MKFINLLINNLKRMTKNKMSMALTVLLPLVGVIGVTAILNGTSQKSIYCNIVNLDRGIYGEKFIEGMEKDYNVKLYSSEGAMEKLKKKQIAEYYEIGENFSQLIEGGEKPELTVNRRETAREYSNFNIVANDLINRFIIKSTIEKATNEEIALSSLDSEVVNIKTVTTKTTDMATQISIRLLISFNFFSAIGICYELFALKTERTLKRSLTTSNKPKIIIGSILGAQFIIVYVSYIAVLFINIILNKKELIAQAPIISFNLAMTTAVALSLAVFISRIVKNEKLIVVVLQIVVCSTCFIGGSFIPIEILPKSISFLSKFTPQYWALESIKTGRYEYSFIVLLFALVLFTAGTISSKSFAEVS